MSTPRKIVSLANTLSGTFVAVGDDGSTWLYNATRDAWQRMVFPPLPDREDES